MARAKPSCGSAQDGLARAMDGFHVTPRLDCVQIRTGQPVLSIGHLHCWQHLEILFDHLSSPCNGQQSSCEAG